MGQSCSVVTVGSTESAILEARTVFKSSRVFARDTVANGKRVSRGAFNR